MAPWSKSTVSESRLNALVKAGVLSVKELIGWRAAVGEEFSTPDTKEIMVHTVFFYRGFLVLVDPFHQGLLYFYGLELHNLNPNGMLHVSAFITLCESFLGIEPHFALWKHLFMVKPQSNKNNPTVVGGAGLQLKPGFIKSYPELPFLNSLKGWHSEWFYCTNPEPSLPGFVGQAPTVKASWSESPQEWESGSVDVLMNTLAEAIRAGVFGVVLVSGCHAIIN